MLKFLVTLLAVIGANRGKIEKISLESKPTKNITLEAPFLSNEGRVSVDVQIRIQEKNYFLLLRAKGGNGGNEKIQMRSELTVFKVIFLEIFF